jgi:anthranilate/para-aminobenzoate synthase component II
MILVIGNYDSFTYNLVQYLGVALQLVRFTGSKFSCLTNLQKTA